MNEQAELENDNESIEDQDESLEVVDADQSVENEGEDQESDDDEVVVSIGEDSPPQEEHTQAPEWYESCVRQIENYSVRTESYKVGCKPHRLGTSQSC